MKKIIQIFSTIALMCLCFSTKGLCAEYTPEDSDLVTYQYSIENEEVTIDKIVLKLVYDIEVNIPEEIEGYPVTQLRQAFCSTPARISKIVLPSGIKKIEENTFDCCSNLHTIVLNEGLEYIGMEAFLECENLKNVNIPDTVKEIGDNAFRRCKSIEEIYIPDSCTVIGNNAFNLCTSLESVRIPDNIKTLGNSAFYGCELLTDVQWNKCVENPGSGIFNETKYLMENKCILLNNDTVLLSYCGSEDFVFPDSVTEVVSSPFSYSTAEKVTLPKRFNFVPDYLFFNMKNLEHVVFEGRIEHIGISAFRQCKNLANLNIPDGTKYISAAAFMDCKKLQTVVLPDSIEFIGENAFYNCSALENVELPNSLHTIDEFAFYGCTAFTKLVIPNSVTELGHRSFRECVNIKNLTIPAHLVPKQVTEITDVFYNDNAIEKITVTNGKYDEYTLWYWFRQTKWAQGNKPKSETGFRIIDNKLVEYDGNDRNPVIPDGVTSIASVAFRNAQIDTVTIPSSVTLIDMSAFINSTIKEIVIPSNVKSVRAQAFAYCEQLTSLVIEDGVKEVGTEAFLSCKSLVPEKCVLSSKTRYNKTAFDDTLFDENWTEEKQPSDKNDNITEDIQSEITKELIVKTGGKTIEVYADNEAVEFTDVMPFIDSTNRTQMPVRAVAEALGCEVDYVDGLVTIRGRKTTINLTIGSDILTKNGEKVQMDTAAVIISDRTFIPVRYIAEALGYTVNWENIN